MEISQRLKSVAGLVMFDIIADIGTDHGYVPIYLAKEARIKKAIASDINKGPIEKADLNIKLHHMENKIETRLGNGLCAIEPGEVDATVISGMGGMLIIDILKQSPKVVMNLKQLVLQPQLDIYEVRKFVHSIGFKIKDEIMVFEDGKFYTAISCLKGTEPEYNETEYWYGKILIDKKDLVLKQYLETQTHKLKLILENIKSKNTDSTKARYLEAQNELQRCKEVLECL